MNHSNIRPRNPAPSRLSQRLSAFKSVPWRSKAGSIGLGLFKVFNVACVLHLFTEYIGRPSLMAGPSMLPTFAESGEVVIEERLSLHLNPTGVSRGDLVTFRSPIDPARVVCKRVLGLPGDIICVDPTGQKAPSTEHVVIPKGHIWISGDNAMYSRDSRDYGPVSMSLLEGKIIARVWPWQDFTIFRNPSTIIR